MSDLMARTRIRNMIHERRSMLTLSAIMLGTFVFLGAQTHIFIAVSIILIAAISSMWRIDESLTHKAGVIYVTAAVLVIWQWKLLVWIYSLTLGFIIQLMSSLYGAFDALIHLELIALIMALYGFFAILLKYLLTFVIKSIPGGFLRLFTIVPAKKALTYAYKKVDYIKNRFDSMVEYMKSMLVLYWTWLKSHDLFTKIYIGAPIGIFAFVLLLIFLFAWGLKTILTTKVGEIAVEKFFMWGISHVPEGLLKNVLKKIYDPIHRFLEFLERGSQEMRASLKKKISTEAEGDNASTLT